MTARAGAVATACSTVLMLGMVLSAIAPARDAWAHPALERAPAHPLMRAPGPASSRRAPVGLTRVKRYLPLRAPTERGTGTAVFQGLLKFYRVVISPVDGDRCSMAPSCSLYSHQALSEHGVLAGILLTADRLLHEGDEIPLVLSVLEGKEKHYLDPLEANTYWWPAWMQ